MLASYVGFVRSLSQWEFWGLGIGMVAAAFASAYFGVNSLYRSRLIADMPTSKLRSAAQGYIELEGWAQMMPGDPIYAPISGLPCVWYEYKVEFYPHAREERRLGWDTVESGTSDAIFYIVDQTGKCVVDPEGAEVTPSVELCWRGHAPRPIHAPKKTSFWSRWFSSAPYRYTERRLHTYDALYAIGYFVGLGCVEQPSISDETRDLLSLWKRDRGGLLQRFDTNRDGKIDLDEWEIARLEAEQEVIASSRQHLRQSEINLLKKPRDGRPFILSSVSQEQIISYNRIKALLGFTGFLTLELILAWTILLRF